MMAMPQQGIEPFFSGSRTYIGPSGDTTGAKDKTKLIAALNRGGLVELGPGDFYINAGIPISVNRTHLVGQGRNNTRINFTGTLTTQNIIEMAAGMTAANIGTGASPSGGPLRQCSIQR